MADDSVTTGLLDPNHQPEKKKGINKKRFRRCRSSPSVDFVLNPQNSRGLFPGSKIIFNNFSPSITQAIIFVLIYLGLGATCFYLVRNQIQGKKTNSFLDALYFVIVTMTTVGYGDLVPNSVASKLLACAFVFSGMAIIGFLLSKAADYLVEKQEVLLIKALNLRHKTGDARMLKDIEMNKAKYKFVVSGILLVIVMVSGTVFLTEVEKLDLVDAFYCVCCTITTLGYGDKSFSSVEGRVFAVFWILAGTICLAQFFLYLAEVFTDSRQRLLAKWVLSRRMTFFDIEAADLDKDGEIGAAEFVIYKLKEMGKINQEDIALIMDEFEELDVDQSGAISAYDILAQSDQ